jgi:hypothetical protein
VRGGRAERSCSQHVPKAYSIRFLQQAERRSLQPFWIRRGETIHRFPEFLPDGKQFLYVANSGNAKPGALRIASVESTESEVLLEGAANAAYVPPFRGRSVSLLFYFDGMLIDRSTVFGIRS